MMTAERAFEYQARAIVEPSTALSESLMVMAWQAVVRELSTPNMTPRLPIAKTCFSGCQSRNRKFVYAPADTRRAATEKDADKEANSDTGAGTERERRRQLLVSNVGNDDRQRQDEPARNLVEGCIDVLQRKVVD